MGTVRQRSYPTHVRDIRMDKNIMTRIKNSFCWMVVVPSTLFFCFVNISCANASNKNKSNYVVSDSDSILSKGSDQYKITKLIVPVNPNKKMRLYQNPSKDAPILKFVVDEEDPEGFGGLYSWDTKGKGETEEFGILSVVGESNDWYTVYVDMGQSENMVFIGYVPKNTCKEAKIMDLRWDDVKKDNFFDNIHKRSNSNYYIKWGLAGPGGPSFIIGEIENGKTYETDECYYSLNANEDSILVETPTGERLSFCNIYLERLMRGDDGKFVYTNSSGQVNKCPDPNDYVLGEYERAFFLILSDTHFQKLVSVSGKMTNQYVKVNGAKQLFKFRKGNKINGKTVMWTL